MDVTIDPDSLQGMKYADLRTLAKSVGIRANMKADKLLQALHKYAAAQSDSAISGPESDTAESASETETESTDQSAEPSSQQDTHDDKLKSKGPKGRNGRKGRKTKPVQPVELEEQFKKVNSPAKLPEPHTFTPTVRKTFTPSLGSNGKPRLLLSASRRLTPGQSPFNRMSTSGSSKPRTSLNKPATPISHTPVDQKIRPSTRTSCSGGGLVTSAGHKRTRSNTPCSTSLTAASGSAAKRQRLESPADTAQLTTPESAAKRHSRYNTYTLDESEVASPKPCVSSPSTQDLLASVHEKMSDGEMKERLMEVIEQKVQNKMETTGDKLTGTQIPRFVAFAAKKKAEAGHQTPGQLRWTKIHARQFEKMDSIDQYLEKKKKRTDQISNSVRKARALAEQARSTLENLKQSTKKATASSIQKSSPRSRSALFKSPATSSVPFLPQVTSVSEASFNFNAKTPSGTCKSVGVPSSCTKENTKLEDPELTNTTSGKQEDAVNGKTEPRKSVGSTLSRKSTGANRGVTPFKFDATVNQDKSCQKPKFDLAASLSQKPTWQQHKGKLKPFVFGDTHQKDVKAVKVTTKEERRQRGHAHRAVKRLNTQMKRRGLAA